MSPSTADSDTIIATLRAAGCVFAEEEARLLVAAATTQAELTVMVDRRAEGAPLEQVIGWAEFCGLRIALDPGVFVPRHRTECLVDKAVAACLPGAIVVDLCCGSGAVSIAVAAGASDVTVHATDVDPIAVRCARRNLAGRGRVHQGDLYAPLPQRLHGRVDVVVTSPPYVPTDEIELLPREARLYEARVALDGGSDGLDVVRRVATDAPRWLAPGGHLLVETSERQAPAAAAACDRAGLTSRVSVCDELEATVVIGEMPR